MPETSLSEALSAAGLGPGDVDLIEDSPVLVWVTQDLPPETAARHWAAAHAVHSRTGLYPVIVGPREAFERNLADAVEMAADEDSAEPATTTASAVFARQLSAMEQDYDDDEPNEFLTEEPDLPATLTRSEGAFLSLDSPQALAFVEATSGSALPGLLGWSGAMNYQLAGAHHSAVLAAWETRWGAQLAVLSFDVIELVVADPPTAAEEVLAVARDQYAYCPDIVEQGVQSIAALCEAVASTHWFFWWD